MTKRTTTARIDIYDDVTARIVAELEKGPDQWTKSWTSSVALWQPQNHGTSRRYRGINVLLLALACQEHGFALNRWLTFRQALALGGCVRKGSQGVRVVFWKQLDAKRSKTTDSATIAAQHDEDQDRGPVVARHFYVFNVSDVDGVAEAQHAPRECTSLAAQLVAASGAQIVLGEPSYRALQDVVMLPEASRFATEADYFATALHELAHWTAPRVGRELNAKRWGDDAYAMEELVAELAAAMLCSACGIPTLMQSASYLDHWLRVLRTDKRAIFSATGAAQKAADYLLDRAGVLNANDGEGESDAAAA
jgi:antirestriction protein ArdC